MFVTLYRGINTAEPTAVMTAINRGEFNHPERDWELRDFRAHITDVLDAPDRFAALKAEASNSSVTWACADRGGAAFYACRGADIPLVVEFRAEAEALTVDCRDLLCTVFQLGSEAERSELDRRAGVLTKLYGEAILPYFRAASEAGEQAHKIALCNVAAQDPEVIRAHLGCEEVVRGRHGTTFRSAFAVRLPLPADAVVRIHTVKLAAAVEAHTVSLRNLLGRE